MLSSSTFFFQNQNLPKFVIFQLIIQISNCILHKGTTFLIIKIKPLVFL